MKSVFLGIQSRAYSTRFAYETHWLSRVEPVPASEEIIDGESYLTETEEGILLDHYPNCSSPAGAPAPTVGDRTFYREVNTNYGEVPNIETNKTCTFEITQGGRGVCATIVATNPYPSTESAKASAEVTLHGLLPHLTPKLAAQVQQNPQGETAVMVMRFAAEQTARWEVTALELEAAVLVARRYGQDLPTEN